MEKANLTYIQQMSGGDQTFEKKLISIIKSEFPEEKKTYLNNLQEKNYKLAAGNVHKIKHKISILGLEKSYKVAEQFEHNLLKSDASMANEFNSILDIITNFLNEL